MGDMPSRDWFCNGDVFFNAPGQIPEDKIDNPLLSFNYAFPIIQTKFQYRHSLTVLNKESDLGITCLIATKNNSLILVNGEEIYCNRGSFVLFFNDKDVEIINGSFDKKTFAFLNQTPVFGHGKTMYRVKSTVKDEYEVDVFADSEEEAIDYASKIDIEQWNHLDIYPDIQEVKFLRFSKWGIFNAKEM